MHRDTYPDADFSMLAIAADEGVSADFEVSLSFIARYDWEINIFRLASLQIHKGLNRLVLNCLR